MGHFSMEIYARTGSNLSGNQQIDVKMLQFANSGLRFALANKLGPCEF